MSAPSIKILPAVPTAHVARHLGRYEILGELASGGTGTVYLARLQGPGGFERLFAIKVLHKQYATRAEVVELLLREAHLAAQVHHPHVVDIVEISTTDDGQHYLVMGYVEGASLDDLLAHPKLDAIRRVRLGLSILLDAMSGLDAVHRAKDATTGEPLGIVHRDVSPANILIGLDGIGRVADFGIASARAHSSISEPGVVRGTPRYMAPEQATGEAPIDARADVFALGAVLWEIITGEPLFDSSVSVEHILRQVLSATIPPPSDRNSRMPEALDAICLRALERDLGKRYATVGELRDALAQAADASGLVATSRELVTELEALFADRIEQRRSLVAGATRRSSGTQLRAVVITEGEAKAAERSSDEDLFDDKTTVFESVPPPRSSGERKSIKGSTQIGLKPLRDAAAEVMARESTTRTGITSTRIGLKPVSAPAPDEGPTSLEELLGGADDEEEEDKVALVQAPAETQALTLPRRHAWRWVAFAVIAFAAFGVWLALKPRTQLAPYPPIAQLEASGPPAVAHPAPAPAPAPALQLDLSEPPPQELGAIDEALPSTIAPKRAKVALRPQPAPKPRLAVAAPSDPDLPLETNPYRLQR
jgi:serine/threonine protein kinase